MGRNQEWLLVTRCGFPLWFLILYGKLTAVFVEQMSRFLHPHQDHEPRVWFTQLWRGQQKGSKVMVHFGGRVLVFPLS